MNEGENKPRWEEKSRETVFPKEGENTFGLSVEHIKYSKGDAVKEYWKYSLPDVAQVVGMTGDGDVISIREQRPGINKEYPHVVGETMEKDENPLISAVRGLLEETGYCPKSLSARGDLIEAVLNQNKGQPVEDLGKTVQDVVGESAVLLSKVLHDTSRSDRKIYCWLLKDCVKVQNGEQDIKVSLGKIDQLQTQILEYMQSDPEVAHAGVNSLVVIALASEHLKRNS